ncbi:efflux RND transporter periplasmic adaptor subunit [Acetobacter peroxydans]|uniref:RND transporter MFP subunit n=1 Tax=Acetobacter peroxydans TaxID=104098 RepID=A0A4Y3TWH7_9PROT|nr:efflux RND transporter periplasmic adaptor subunit [Acetobacter peroxydans]NHO17018.1 efflux RND transporter periplasmic adaptor subunit [Acetobacter peroxydans]GBR33911.1 multidrug efflux pump acriflavin resistance protein AcrB/AcrD/AcrF [Acetobacter peroxydans NBRC 13755]GBR44976.1 multidrug efflux pump acriflavin resistance protein AcrB/AcrD/AcrF [Acetobacter peroxydans]GEB86058.1 RND transporter MFP subunit [Acetobacter peroxydans]
MSVSRKGRIFIILLVTVMVADIGYLLVQRARNNVRIQQDAAYSRVPDVALVQPKPAPPTMSMTLPGTISAWYEAPIYAQVSGYVKMWYRDYGAIVKKGDMLAEINTPRLDAEYAQAQADLKVAQAKYGLAAITATRWRSMGQSQAVSGQSVSVQNANEQSAKAELEAAEHKVAQYQAMIHFKSIEAPFDGVVIARNINVGDYVGAGSGSMNANGTASELFTVADTHAMRLFVSVPETFSSMLRPGLVAKVSVPQFPNKVFDAKFLTVAKGFDPNTRTVVTEFSIDNAEQKLWPGSFASVTLTAPADKGIYTIPTGALVFQEHGMQVATVDAADVTHYRNITVGRMSDAYTEVSAGLSPSDRIINNPPADLMEGDKVRPVDPEKGYLSTPAAAGAAGEGDEE